MTDISYESLVEKSLLNVVKEALKIAERDGLGTANHFYITFQTDRDDVVLSDRLKASYPDEMTIVLQHEYSDLTVSDTDFSVKLSFANIPERIVVPYAALIRFADPYAKFALSFTPQQPEKPKKESKKTDGNQSENVVSFSAFRKKK